MVWMWVTGGMERTMAKGGTQANGSRDSPPLTCLTSALRLSFQPLGGGAMDLTGWQTVLKGHGFVYSECPYGMDGGARPSCLLPARAHHDNKTNTTSPIADITCITNAAVHPQLSPNRLPQRASLLLLDRVLALASPCTVAVPARPLTGPWHHVTGSLVAPKIIVHFAATPHAAAVYR